MSPTVFVRRLTIIIDLLRASVDTGEFDDLGMTVAQANATAGALTRSPNQKKEFFAQSERKQAKAIGCSWGTWSKTSCFLRAVESGWLPKRKKSANNVGGGSHATVSLTPTLEATHGKGNKDEILNQLIHDESNGTNARQWDDLSSEERRQFLAEHEADAAENPSPLSAMSGNSRGRKRR